MANTVSSSRHNLIVNCRFNGQLCGNNCRIRTQKNITFSKDCMLKKFYLSIEKWKNLRSLKFLPFSYRIPSINVIKQWFLDANSEILLSQSGFFSFETICTKWFSLATVEENSLNGQESWKSNNGIIMCRKKS